MLMFGAFLAGLLVVGAVFLLSGEGDAPSAPAYPPASRTPQSQASQVAPPPAARTPQSQGPQGLPPPAAPVVPRLAIVVDGFGYEPSRDAEWLKLPATITAAVIPFGPSSRRMAESARARGWGVILHVPMEPVTPSADRTERFRIRRGMSADEMDALLARMAENLPQARGASNHMGSAVTADPQAMDSYVSALKKRGYFLLDSVTTSSSVALEAARRAGVPAARRDVYLDAGKNPEEVRRQWERAVAIARERGAAVVICQGRMETLRMMLELLPRLKNEKIQTVTLEELLLGKRTEG
jgi:polysaccharide deacetylase 2 family uncharacterized protein YibQ